MKKVIFLISILFFYACSDSQSPTPIPTDPQNPTATGWTIPENEVLNGGPGKDGIPSIDDPKFISNDAVKFMTDNDLILALKHGDEVRGYPHPILDWHEIVNDKIADLAIAVTYCPLTGTGIGWDRMVDKKETTFGVSGLLYNSNLIPYDRETDSFWSQMRMDCVNGDLVGTEINTYPLVEMSWKTWKEYFPSGKVMSTETGRQRSYGVYPYGDYKISDRLIFPVSNSIASLPTKERVLGVFVENLVRIYRFSNFTGPDYSVIEEDYLESPLVVVGNQGKNVIAAFSRNLEGNIRTFKGLGSGNGQSIMKDDLGNVYNIFGEVVSGPNKGSKLPSVRNFIGYGFVWGAFYDEGLSIFE